MTRTMDTDRRGLKYANKGGSATAGRGYDRHAEQRLVEWFAGYEQELEERMSSRGALNDPRTCKGR